MGDSRESEMQPVVVKVPSVPDVEHRAPTEPAAPLRRLVGAAASSHGPGIHAQASGRAQRSSTTVIQREPGDEVAEEAESDESAGSTPEPEVSRASIKMRLAEIIDDIKAVREFPGYHNPTDLKSTGQAFQVAFGAKKYGEADIALRAVRSMVSLAKSFAARLNEIEAQAETVSNVQQQANIVTWIDKHKAFTWEQAVATKDDSHTKGALAHLEDRLDNYAQRAADASASADAATQKKLDAAQAARDRAKERKRKISEGLLTGDGRAIAQKTTGDFKGDELEAINATLGVIDGGESIRLTHHRGAKFGDEFKNRDGDLPGVARGGGYLEYYVEKDSSDSTYHGGRRLLKHVSTGRVYYTNTHYGDNGSPAFVRIR
jgi:hypothetical protein